MRDVSAIVACLSTFVVCGCPSIKANVPVDASHRLNMKAVGVKARAESICLRPSAIRELTGSEIPDGATKKSCYRTILISSDSSSIARAVSAFASAERELKELVEPLPSAASPATSDIATSIVEDAATAPSAVLVANARGVAEGLDANEKSSVKSYITNTASAVQDEHLKRKLLMAADAIE